MRKYLQSLFFLLLSGCSISQYLDLNRSLAAFEFTNADPLKISGTENYKEGFVVFPGTFVQNHGSSLAELDDGSVLITWFAGLKEAGPDIQIFSVRYFPDGHYSQPSVVVKRHERPKYSLLRDKSVGNTALFLDSEKKLWLFYNAIPFGGWSLAMVNYKVSRDGGKTWSNAERFISGFGNLVRNKPVSIDDNSFILPIYTELFTHKGYACLVRYRDAKIVSKECGSAAEREGAIQPAVVRMRDGRLIAFFRDKKRKNVYRSESSDGGITWEKPAPTNLPNSNSAVAAVSVSGDRILIVYNNSLQKRTPLSVAVSKDYGKKFFHLRDLENSDAGYSYPEIIRTKDSKFHIVYSYEGKTIKHVVFDEKWLLGD